VFAAGCWASRGGPTGRREDRAQLDAVAGVWHLPRGIDGPLVRTNFTTRATERCLRNGAATSSGNEPGSLPTFPSYHGFAAFGGAGEAKKLRRNRIVCPGLILTDWGIRNRWSPLGLLEARRQGVDGRRACGGGWIIDLPILSSAQLVASGSVGGFFPNAAETVFRFSGRVLRAAFVRQRARFVLGLRRWLVVSTFLTAYLLVYVVDFVDRGPSEVGEQFREIAVLWVPHLITDRWVGNRS